VVQTEGRGERRGGILVVLRVYMGKIVISGAISSFSSQPVSAWRTARRRRTTCYTAASLPGRAALASLAWACEGMRLVSWNPRSELPQCSLLPFPSSSHPLGFLSLAAGASVEEDSAARATCCRYPFLLFSAQTCPASSPRTIATTIFF
jgi:hypothetical protein